MSAWPETDNLIIKNEEKNFEDNFNSSNLNKTTKFLPDHDQYLKCLESKLKKIKENKVIKSKELIISLKSLKEDTMNNLLNKSEDLSINNSNNEDFLNELEPVNQTFIEKKIYPERQALTLEEQIALLTSDHLAKRTEENSN